MSVSLTLPSHELANQEDTFIRDYAAHYELPVNLTRSEIIDCICASHPTIPILPNLVFIRIETNDGIKTVFTGRRAYSRPWTVVTRANPAPTAQVPSGPRALQRGAHLFIALREAEQRWAEYEAENTEDINPPMSHELLQAFREFRERSGSKSNTDDDRVIAPLPRHATPSPESKGCSVQAMPAQFPSPMSTPLPAREKDSENHLNHEYTISPLSPSSSSPLPAQPANLAPNLFTYPSSLPGPWLTTLLTTLVSCRETVHTAFTAAQDDIRRALESVMRAQIALREEREGWTELEGYLKDVLGEERVGRALGREGYERGHDSEHRTRCYSDHDYPDGQDHSPGPSQDLSSYIHTYETPTRPRPRSSINCSSLRFPPPSRSYADIENDNKNKHADNESQYDGDDNENHDDDPSDDAFLPCSMHPPTPRFKRSRADADQDKKNSDTDLDSEEEREVERSVKRVRVDVDHFSAHSTSHSDAANPSQSEHENDAQPVPSFAAPANPFTFNSLANDEANPVQNVPTNDDDEDEDEDTLPTPPSGIILFPAPPPNNNEDSYSYSYPEDLSVYLPLGEEEEVRLTAPSDFHSLAHINAAAAPPHPAPLPNANANTEEEAVSINPFSVPFPSAPFPPSDPNNHTNSNPELQEQGQEQEQLSARISTRPRPRPLRRTDSHVYADVFGTLRVRRPD
ncbi:hypothetical protein J132_08890 [Termitomyces sp. J132]|nr:hypothetical protein H2248_003401 [Termitomyces sp. 'cryptogamus']KNZ79679.1 hypothetical protein J132_08890 [Termitomyces sp. J132]